MKKMTSRALFLMAGGFLILLTLFLSSACGRKDVNRRGDIKLRGERPVSLKGKRPGDLLQKGTASWYGKPYHGRKTANGETYNMWEMTAAHKTLPFNTLVKVTHRRTGRTMVVRINDRGPFIRGRIIDLSRKAADQLGIFDEGVADVTLRLAKAHDPMNAGATKPRITRPQRQAAEVAGFWTIQVGSFSERARAEAMAQRVRPLDQRVFIESKGGMYRVRVGRFPSKKAAFPLAQALHERDIDLWILLVPKSP